MQTTQHTSVTYSAVRLDPAKVGQIGVGQAMETFLALGLTGSKPNTIDWYRKRLTNLVGYLGPTTPVGSVMDGDLLAWYSGLATKKEKWGKGSSHPSTAGGLSVNYLHGMVRAARYLFKWLAEFQILTADPARVLKLPRLPKTGRRGILDAHAAKILALAQAGLGDGHQVRDYAVLRFLESTGCRLAGLANLTLEDLFLDQPDPGCRQATVREKGDKERPVFMTHEALDALLAWLAVRPEGSRRVFQLTQDGVYQMVRRYAEAAGLTQPVKDPRDKPLWSPHQWRHRFGRRMAQKGMNLGILSQIMGHESVEITVKFYGIFSQGELQASFDRYSGTM